MPAPAREWLQRFAKGRACGFHILVGDADEQVVADQFAPLLQRLDVNIPVMIVPDMKHADMIARPEALQVVACAVSQHE